MNGYRFPDMTVGVCYYPEHWDESLWADDLDRMLDSGITVVRIAEFAWSVFERTEGVFTFDFFDRFLELCSEKGMKVIFGTPTATPPAWLTEKYPEVLNADRSGFVMACALLGWGGISVHCQTAAVLSGTGLPLKGYLKSKLLHGIFSAFLGFFAWNLL